ncbi:hypothetical protein ACSVDE_04035 [Pseudalkalibacillus sp. Hm43]|uniref:hypothetical protein n=1 Tax=Pseudalkalibacillus sp. Hm43 TaxID=3450742 RepID=UPI003F426D79
MKLTSKKAVVSGVAASLAGVATYYLKDRSNRIKMKETFNDLTSKIKERTNGYSDSNVPLDKAGEPQDLEDSKMVDEGAQTSVDYYNKTQQ